MEELCHRRYDKHDKKKKCEQPFLLQHGEGKALIREENELLAPEAKVSGRKKNAAETHRTDQEIL